LERDGDDLNAMLFAFVKKGEAVTLNLWHSPMLKILISVYTKPRINRIYLEEIETQEDLFYSEIK